MDEVEFVHLGPISHHSYPDLAQFGRHHKWRHAIIIEHLLQAAVRVQFGALDQKQVIHLCEETGVVLGVVRNVHQGVQDCVAPGILAPQVGLLVGILGQVVHNVRLVGAGGQ